ncbi:hypothetical protein CDEF62S_00626 [Castellaniella defragrans]
MRAARKPRHRTQKLPAFMTRIITDLGFPADIAILVTSSQQGQAVNQPTYIQCPDDTADIPAGVDHVPALMLNSEAPPVVLLSAASARTLRMIQSLETYAVIPTDQIENALDTVSMHAQMTALHNQAKELHQILTGCITRLTDKSE